MHAGEPFTSSYLVDVLRILESAAKQSAQVVTRDEDPDLAIYLNSLREALVECYTTIVHGVSQSNNNYGGLISCAPNIITYLS